MAGEGLQDRINRLNLEGQKKEQGEAAERQLEERHPIDPGPAHANEHWRALYARVREIAEGLRR